MTFAYISALYAGVSIKEGVPEHTFLPAIVLATYKPFTDDTGYSRIKVLQPEVGAIHSRTVPTEQLIDAQRWQVVNVMTEKDDGFLGDEELENVIGKTRFFRLETEDGWDQEEYDDDDLVMFK